MCSIDLRKLEILTSRLDGLLLASVFIVFSSREWIETQILCEIGRVQDSWLPQPLLRTVSTDNCLNECLAHASLDYDAFVHCAFQKVLLFLLLEKALWVYK